LYINGDDNGTKRRNSHIRHDVVDGLAGKNSDAVATAYTGGIKVIAAYGYSLSQRAIGDLFFSVNDGDIFVPPIGE
jgi:hypothetical protein